MLIQDTIFYTKEWRWNNFIKYLIFNLREYNCLEKKIPSEYLYKESTYGSKKSKKNVNLFTWAAKHNQRIKFARAVCINSPNYSVLNFLIIPNTSYNVPFFGVDFVSLPNSHLLVLDFQPSLNIDHQFRSELLGKLIKLKKICHSSLPIAQEMSSDVARFFSPGLIWSKLPKEERSDYLKINKLNKVNQFLNSEQIQNNQIKYDKYSFEKDPADKLFKSFFGEKWTKKFINKFLFTLNKEIIH